VAAGLLALLVACGGEGDGRVEEVMIPRGSGFAAVIDSLEAHGLVESPRMFRLIARVGGYDRSVKAGLYEFRRGASPLAILRALQAGRVVQVRVTVPEGFTVADIARVAEERLGVPGDSVLAAARDTAWLRAQGIEGPTAEGFLLPETYHFSGTPSAREFLRTMLAAFQAAWEPGWDSVLAATGRTRLEVVTLASIVEGEAHTDDERPIIAGVYANRLRIGMALQADPTVQYALQQRTGERKSRLFEKDYLTPSPYNTYLFPGLPPGPVGAPGRESLRAALHPAEVPYLYFVAGPEGRHTFSRTYEDHLRAVARARRAR
jgi:UPF0755 protein